MRILAIDTSGQQAGVAVVKKGGTHKKIIIEAHTEPKGWRHSEMLLPTVAKLFEDNGLTLANIHCVAYTNGPGSFTGLRIGAATALGLARGAGLPVVQVPTLDVMAYTKISLDLTHTSDLTPKTETIKIIPMMDARRGQVYAAVYERGKNGKMKRLTDYLAVPENELTEQTKDALVTKKNVDPVFVGLWAMENIHLSSGSPGELLYIRAPQAVRETGKNAH
jgi:tRNA threonylcarbamoyladenosine biosynthesis protein TsaB